MTKIIVKYDKSLCSFIELSGHAGYARSGYDIVCSGITTATFTSINLIEKINKLKLINLPEEAINCLFLVNFLYLDLTDFYFGGTTLLGSDEDGNEIGEGMLGSRLDIPNFCHKEPIYDYKEIYVKYYAVDICLNKSTKIEILINCYPQYPHCTC